MECHLYAAGEAKVQNSLCIVTEKNPSSMHDSLVFVISTNWKWSWLFLL